MDPTAYTPPSSLKPAATLAELGKIIRDTFLPFAFESEGQPFALRIRRIPSAEMDEANAHVRNLLPPVRPEYLGAKDGDGKLKWDFDSPSAELKARIEERGKAMGAPANLDGSGPLVPLPFPLAARYEKWDHDDKDYLAQVNLAQQRQAATILHYGCEGGLEGASADDKARTMRQLLPNTVIRLLVDRLITIGSTGVIDRASFFTPAG